MADMFEFKASDLINLRRFYKKAPGKFTVVMAGVVNAMAFGTRAVSLEIINKRMTIRNPRFVKSRVRVTKARASRLVAEMGSIETPRFSGWAEQESGDKTKRTRVFNVMARGGSNSRQVMPSARLKPGANHITDSRYAGKSTRFRTMLMLLDIKRRRIRRPFVIRKHRKIKPGLYRMQQGKIQQLQQFKTSRQPRRVRWLSGAMKQYVRPGRIRGQWAKAVAYALRKR